jgi:hypothetical protein
MLLAAGLPRQLGVSPSRLTFDREPGGPGTTLGRRILSLDVEPAFELSWWCGTCPFLFERLAGASDTLSIEALTDRLSVGLDDLDGEVIDTFASLLPPGRYLPLLLRVQPRGCIPSRPGDYFAEEQVSTWGLQSFWGLPESPRTAYYRTFETAIEADAHLYEFVVPMTPLWNEESKVAEYAKILQASSAPTAVAISTLDVCQPATDSSSTDYYQHWGLTHFLLDGHHKMHAAADTGRPLRLLSLLSIDGSLATPEQVARIPQLRNQSPSRRGSN